MILGAMMLVDAPLRISWSAVLPAVAAMAVGTLLLVRLVVQSQRRHSVTGVAGMLGARGVADTELQPEGWVLLMGERWRGVADAPLPAGSPVQVTSVDGLRLRVKKAEEAR
jgi:membrane-bound serine protease (ClpP class)